MLTHILSTISPIALIALLGYVWSYNNLSYDGRFISQLVMNIASPCLILVTLLRVELAPEHLWRLSLVTLSGLAVMLLLNTAILRIKGWPIRSYLSALTFANTGNMGIPIAMFAFGEYALALALVVFMVTSLVHFTLGVAVVGGHHPFKALFQSPVFYAATLSVVMLVNQWQLPKGLFNAIELLGNLAIPLMLFSLGVSLQSIRIHAMGRSVALALVRLVVGAGTGFFVSWVFDLSGLEAGVVILLFSMPSAVFNYLLAVNYRRQPEDVAGVVVISTLLSLVTLPALLWVLLERS
ncbi:Uncharacterised protein [BD1-7 clade bacterium]|uniref:AEC family transporter n=1 Tax=BD1-7 clade bacterium TaxID=2029982 RepID=A0A5S9PP34_9GAMM|nr:Uncharacterised protein [BD1-7 clade bacterium]CAA0106218.1 Uncharacterised protein [BD1-7 clade bacterium]